MERSEKTNAVTRQFSGFAAAFGWGGDQFHQVRGPEVQTFAAEF
jgi:hypothetical protein